MNSSNKQLNSSNKQLAAFRGAIFCLATIATGVAATTPVVAAPPEQPPSVRVRYDDLDLSTQEGNEALYRRISLAARSVCPGADSRELAVRAASRSCQMAAIERAVSDVNSPRLAQLLASRSGRG